MSYVQLGTHQAPGSGNTNNTSAGSPGESSDGINWPYNQNGQTPNFQINWNSNPPPTVQQIEATYEALINWLKNNTGSPAFYNGSILFLQMTMDIGQHMGHYSQANQKQLSAFLSNQINTGGNQIFLQMVIQVAAQATAVSSKDGHTGYNNAVSFLTQLENSASPLAGLCSTFAAIADEAHRELDNDSGNNDSIYNWIFGSAQAGLVAHWGSITNSSGGTIDTWVDDEKGGDWDPTINGQQAMTFLMFTEDAQFALGTALTPSNNTSVNSTIDAYYQTQINALVAQFKGNPWALLAALMNLINERDQDNGTAVNGYGGTENVLTQANGIIQKMLGDISGTTPDTADFYVQLQKLKNLVLNNPSLTSVASQLEADIGTINGQTVAGSALSKSWTVKAGYYNFPPGSWVSFNGNAPIQVPASGVVYVPNDNTSVALEPKTGATYTFGQLAAMGDTGDIAKQMEAWANPDNTTPTNNTNWSGQIMSNFENGVTGMQTLLNSPSAAIQQQIQNTTQTMQAEENFEKEAYASITDVNTQVMKLVQSVMG